MKKTVYFLIFLLLTCNSKVEELPIYGRKKIIKKKINGILKTDTLDHTVSDFKFINQDGDSISNNTFQNDVYLADFFFTTCQDICPIMTKNMYKLQQELKNENDILFLSHTVLPEIDTVEQLKKYAIENNVDDSKWNLVTGEKKQIYDLARKSYLAVEDAEYGKFDMIHTENFMLIDKQRQIRGFYDGTNDEEIEQLLYDIQILKKLNYD